MTQIDTATSIPSVLGWHASRLWWLPVVRGVIAIGLALMLLFWPAATVLVVVYTFAFFAIVDGVFAAIAALIDRDLPGWGWNLAYGVLGVILGIMMLVWPVATVVVVFYIIAAWALVIGISAVAGAISMSGTKGSGWGWVLAWGIVSMLFSIALVAAPGAGLMTLLVLFAVFALVEGIALIVAGFALRSVGKRLEA